MSRTLKVCMVRPALEDGSDDESVSSPVGLPLKDYIQRRGFAKQTVKQSFVCPSEGAAMIGYEPDPGFGVSRWSKNRQIEGAEVYLFMRESLLIPGQKPLPFMPQANIPPAGIEVLHGSQVVSGVCSAPAGCAR